MKPQPESKSTRSLRSTTSALALLALVAGCASPGEVVVNGADSEELQQLESINFFEAQFGEDIGLVHGDRELMLGGSRDSALAIFEPLEGSIEFSSLPKQFGKKFSAFGWEKGDFAFGGITFERTDEQTMVPQRILVLAMYTQDHVDDQMVDPIVERYKYLYGDPTDSLTGARIAYWFWARPGRRLMVNTSVNPKGSKSVTVALGETQVMTLLGMSPDQAKLDKSKAIESLNAATGP